MLIPHVPIGSKVGRRLNEPRGSMRHESLKDLYVVGSCGNLGGVCPQALSLHQCWAQKAKAPGEDLTDWLRF